ERESALFTSSRRTTSTRPFWKAVGPVVGRLCATAAQPSSSLRRTHRTRSANDRSAKSCQSDTSERIHSVSACPRDVGRLTRALRRGSHKSSHGGRHTQ